MYRIEDPHAGFLHVVFAFQTSTMTIDTKSELLCDAQRTYSDKYHSTQHYPKSLEIPWLDWSSPILTKCGRISREHAIGDKDVWYQPRGGQR